MWARGLGELLRRGRLLSAGLWCGLSCLALLNRLLMGLEDWLFPGLERYAAATMDQPGKMVFIIGHQRSGTTNVHKALSSLDGVTTGTQFDLIFPSLLLKSLFRPLVGMVNRVFFRAVVQSDVPNHKFGVFEELEEHLLLLHHFGSEVVSSVIFPPLGDGPEYLTSAVRFEPRHMQFVRASVARMLHHQGRLGTRYVGCPLSFSVDPALLRTHFPQATIIVCVRDPVGAFPSFVDLLGALTKAPRDALFEQRMRVVFSVYSTKAYKALAEWPGDDKTLWLDFENWKADAVGEIEWLWRRLGWTAPEGASKAALVRSERHVNSPESFKVVPREQIVELLHPAYHTLVDRCAKTRVD